MALPSARTGLAGGLRWKRRPWKELPQVPIGEGQSGWPRRPGRGSLGFTLSPGPSLGTAGAPQALQTPTPTSSLMSMNQPSAVTDDRGPRTAPKPSHASLDGVPGTLKVEASHRSSP